MKRVSTQLQSRDDIFCQAIVLFVKKVITTCMIPFRFIHVYNMGGGYLVFIADIGSASMEVCFAQTSMVLGAYYWNVELDAKTGWWHVGLGI
jgi:hypothetical protein